MLGIFLFLLALGPTQRPIQWVSGALSLGGKRPGREADHSFPSTTEVKKAWSIRLQDVVLRTGYVIMAWYLVMPKDNFILPYLWIRRQRLLHPQMQFEVAERRMPPRETFSGTDIIK